MADARAAVTGRDGRVEPRWMERGVGWGDCDFRQVRHHTKNVVQQILLQIEHARDMEVTVLGRRLLADLQYRVVLSAQISDALFGITRSPPPMLRRLRLLSDSTIRMLADGIQAIRLDVAVAGDCPAALQQLVLRITHEFVGNAVKHGMHGRVAGTISVRLTSSIDSRTALVVTDDGWGFNGTPDAGEGLTVAGDLAATAGGVISLLRTDVTVAKLELPRAQRGPD